MDNAAISFFSRIPQALPLYIKLSGLICIEFGS